MSEKFILTFAFHCASTPYVPHKVKYVVREPRFPSTWKKLPVSFLILAERWWTTVHHMTRKNWLTSTCTNQSGIVHSWPTSNFKISVTQWPSLQIGEALFAFVRDSYAHLANGTSINSITVVQQRPRPSWKCGKPDSRKTFYRLFFPRKPFPAASASCKRIQVVWLVTYYLHALYVKQKWIIARYHNRFCNFFAHDIRLWVIPITMWA